MPPKVYRFVQLSDIHFGQERDGSLPRHEDVRTQLIADAKAVAAERGGASMVLVVGDTAFAGKKEEYDRAGVWLDELTKAIRCPEKAVRLVPGNHDCDRQKVNTICRTLHRKIRESETARAADAFLHKIASETDSNPLLEKLRAYHDFASGYDCPFHSNAAPFWWHDLDVTEGVKLRLIGMNSVQVCDDEDDVGRLVLGQAQYAAVPAASHILPVVLVHHPLHWFMDKAEAEPYLHNRVHLILVGHEHVSKINKITTAANHERIDLYSGATNPSETGPLYRHTYNWIELSLLNKAGTYSLRVKVFPRTWIPELTRFRPDVQRLNGSESVEFEIACPLLKPLPTEQIAAPVPEMATTVPTTSSEVLISPSTVVSMAAASGVTPTPVTDPKGGATVPREDDVAQLKFLFWRHLDWRQRLEVLVKADVLPPSAEKPVSHNLERMAIDKASAEGKLVSVWDEMMLLLPPDKQKANPFKKS